MVGDTAAYLNWWTTASSLLSACKFWYGFEVLVGIWLASLTCSRNLELVGIAKPLLWLSFYCYLWIYTLCFLTSMYLELDCASTMILCFLNWCNGIYRTFFINLNCAFMASILHLWVFYFDNYIYENVSPDKINKLMK